MRFIAALLVVALSLTITPSGFAQLIGGSDQPSTEFLPNSAFVGATAFPQQLAEIPNFKLFPREVVTAFGKKELGFDPMLIKQITWIMRAPKNIPPQNPPEWAAIMHFEKMQGLAGGMIDRLEEKKIAGKTTYSGTQFGMPSFLVFDESTIIVGEESLFESMLTADGSGKLVDLIKNAKVKGQLVAFAQIEPIRPLIDFALEETSHFVLPPPIERMKLIPNLLESVELGVDSSESLEGTIVLHANNSKSAEELNEIIVDGLEFGREALLAQMASQLDMNDPVQAATVQYTKRIYEKYESKLTPEVNGSELTVKFHEEILALPFLGGMLGSSISMDVPQRVTPENQLRETALAFHNYTSVYQKFPGQCIRDENGKALFSGRVAMLPYMEQNNLFQSLRMDEPWDSPHNRQFTSMEIPGFGSTGEGGGMSTVRFPVYPNSLWDENANAKGFRDITDGTSNTIFAIHAPPGSAVEWANPEPWKISTSNPMADVFGDRETVTVAMMDGSSRVLRKSEMTNQKLKALLTISGGEVIND